jgi:hypothetical protein
MVTWDHRRTVSSMADELNTNNEAIPQNIHEDLQKKKMCTKFVPHGLTDEQT